VNVRIVVGKWKKGNVVTHSVRRFPLLTNAEERMDSNA
jgi:hypothetical protein